MAELKYMELNLMQIYDVLRSAHLLRLAVCVGGKPYVVPVAYQLEVTGRQTVLHLASPDTGRKLDALDANSCFSAELEQSGCAWLDTVIIDGTASVRAAEEHGVEILLRAETMSGRRYFLPAE